jgi:Mg-chelatase subunit ChlI
MASSSTKDAEQRAEIAARKAQKASDGEKAMAQYEADARAVRANTERLRALRLAKESADAATAASAKPAKSSKAGKAVSKAAKKPAKSAAKKAVPLSSWLSAQKGEGRRG